MLMSVSEQLWADLCVKLTLVVVLKTMYCLQNFIRYWRTETRLGIGLWTRQSRSVAPQRIFVLLRGYRRRIRGRSHSVTVFSCDVLFYYFFIKTCTMWPIPYIMHIIKRSSSEITGLILIVSLLYLIKIGMLWKVLNYLRAAFAMVRRRTGPLSLSFGVVNDEPPERLDRASWELRKETIGVYSIQGRRPHMEDRFNVVDLEQNNTSIYGVYDGHGGEVRQ